MRTFVITLFCLLVGISSSEAKTHHYRHYHRAHHAHYTHIAVNKSASCVESDVMRPCYMQSIFAQAVQQRSNRRAEPIAQTVSFSPIQTIERGAAKVVHAAAEVIGGRPAGCPYQYCGCYVSLKVFGRIVPGLNLAANWGQFPSAAAASGMVAYRNHHVFYIASVNSDGTVVAYDGNSGRHLTRVHTVSLRGYRVVNPNGGTRYASS